MWQDCHNLMRRALFQKKIPPTGSWCKTMHEMLELCSCSSLWQLPLQLHVVSNMQAWNGWWQVRYQCKTQTGSNEERRKEERKSCTEKDQLLPVLMGSPIFHSDKHAGPVHREAEGREESEKGRERERASWQSTRCESSHVNLSDSNAMAWLGGNNIFAGQNLCKQLCLKIVMWKQSANSMHYVVNIQLEKFRQVYIYLHD